MPVPVNLKEKDAFHLTIEEYLLALISMVEELVRTNHTPLDLLYGYLTPMQSRLAVNSVTLGDYNRPVQIGKFIKDLFGGFQLLNLKNDILRKRSDGIKYSVSQWPLWLAACLDAANGDVIEGQEGRGCGVRFVSAQFDSQGKRCGLICPGNLYDVEYGN